MKKEPGKQGGMKILSTTKRKTNRKRYISDGEDGIDRKEPSNCYYESYKFVQVYENLK